MQNYLKNAALVSKLWQFKAEGGQRGIVQAGGLFTHGATPPSLFMFGTLSKAPRHQSYRNQYGLQYYTILLGHPQNTVF